MSEQFSKSGSKIVERAKIDTPHTNLWLLTFLALYRYFNKNWWG